jgi:hypothetical protein
MAGICVGLGVLALCCSAPALIGAFVAGSGVALGDWTLAAAGVAIAVVGAIRWRWRRGAGPPAEMARPDRSGA